MNSGIVVVGTDGLTTMTSGRLMMLDVADEIEIELVVERRVDRTGYRAQQKRIAIRSRTDDRLGADVGAATRGIAGRDAPTTIVPSNARRCRTRRQRKPERPRAPAATDRLAPMRSARRPTTRQRLRDARIGDGEVSRVMLHELEHPCPPAIISKSSLNVRFWHKADIPARSTNVRFRGDSVAKLSCSLHLG